MLLAAVLVLRAASRVTDIAHCASRLLPLVPAPPRSPCPARVRSAPRLAPRYNADHSAFAVKCAHVYESPRGIKLSVGCSPGEGMQSTYLALHLCSFYYTPLTYAIGRERTGVARFRRSSYTEGDRATISLSVPQSPLPLPLCGNRIAQRAASLSHRRAVEHLEPSGG